MSNRPASGQAARQEFGSTRRTYPQSIIPDFPGDAMPVFRPDFLRALLAATLLLTAGFPLPVAAQVGMSATAGLGGWARSDGWFPIRVTLSNPGPPARVEVWVRGVSGEALAHLAPRTLRTGAYETHTLYVRWTTSWSILPLHVELHQNGRVVGASRVTPHPLGNEERLIAAAGPGALPLMQLDRCTLRAIGPSLSGLPQIARPTEALRVTILNTAELPDRWQGLSAADTLVLAGVSERELTPQQLTAIRHYVAAGGQLVVTGGSNWKRLTTPFFADLLPVQVIGSRAARSFPPPAPAPARLQGASGELLEPDRFFWLQRPVTSSAPLVLSRAVARPGAACEFVLRSGDEILAASARRGNGSVVFLAFDPAAPAFVDPARWEWNRRFWGDLAALKWSRNASYVRPPGGLQGDPLEAAVTAAGQPDVPAFYLLALYLLAYVVVLVPVNYYFLKARDRREYAWLTTPVIVLVFSLGAYLIGYGARGGRTRIVQLGILETCSNQTEAATRAVAGIFSPARRRYQVRATAAPGADDDLPLVFRSGRDLFRRQRRFDGDESFQEVREDGVQALRDLAVNMWSVELVRSEGVARLDGPLVLRRKPGSSPAQARWVLENRTGLALEDCVLSPVGRPSRNLGAIPAGATVEFEDDRSLSEPWKRLALAPSYPGPTVSLLGRASGEEALSRRLKVAVIQSWGLWGSRGAVQVRWPMLIGWVRRPAIPVQVDRPFDEQALTLVVVHLESLQTLR